MTEVGGKEFNRLVRNVGLDSKLEEENLTVFVPTDDALATYMTSNRMDSVTAIYTVEIYKLQLQITNTFSEPNHSILESRIHSSSAKRIDARGSTGGA